MLWNKDIEGPALEVARHPGDPLRVLAGPGTGKSFALKRRVARLLEQGVSPNQILAVTFTRVAAKDLVADLNGLGVSGCEQVRAGTLHSLCFYILSRESVLQLTGRNPRTMLKHEVKFLIRDLPADTFGDVDSRWAQLRDFEAAWARLQHDQPGWPSNLLDQQFQQAVLTWLKFHKAMLVGELVPETLRFLRDNPAAPERGMFKYVLVDEFQDLNKAEQELIDLLATGSNLTVIGDDDQSIYGFKHANPEGIIEFPDTHPGTSSLTMLECRRCPTSVVKIANALIAHDLGRLMKSLVARPQNGAGEVHILQWRTMDEEVDGITTIVASKITAKIAEPHEILILAPRRIIGYKIRDVLLAKGLAVQLSFEDETLDSTNAQERFSLLNLVADPDDRVALRVLMGWGSHDGRAGAWGRLRRYCESNGQTPWQALQGLANGTVSLPYMDNIVDRFRVVRSEMEKLKGLGLEEFIKAWAPESITETEDLRELGLEVSPQAADIQGLYRELQMRISQPEIPDATGKVRVMSLHKSKGLTAKIVVVVACVEGLIPSGIRDTDSPAEQLRKIEEFRRLFYVAITRTKNTLVLSNTLHFGRRVALQMGAKFEGRGNNVRTIASRFISELGPDAPKSVDGRSYLANL